MSSSDSVREMDLVAVATAVAVAAAGGGRMVAGFVASGWLEGEEGRVFFPFRYVILERVLFSFLLSL